MPILKSFLTFAACLFMSLCTIQAADLPTLAPGDVAPEIQVESWVKGEAIPKFEKNNVYIVEFWATWCPPCIESIPHLSMLQKKYKDKKLTIIGVSLDSEGVEKVQKFVEKQGEKMDYTVALDKASKNDGESLTSAAYMTASQQSGIPCAFIVNAEGKIAWIGYPLEVDEVIESVLDNKWDTNKARETFMAEAKRRQKLEEYGQILQLAIDNKNYPKIIATIDQLHQEVPEVFGESKWGKELFKFEQLLHSGGSEYAYKVGDKIFEDCQKDQDAAIVLTTMTSSCLQSPERKDLDVTNAIKYAEKANELTMGKDTRSLVILAQAYHENKDQEKSVTTLKKAIDTCSDPRIKPQLENLMKEFEEGKESK